ncbi:osmotically inducible protein C [Anoxybacillus gonensis]|uniref:OsmC family protein n=1 Tax=Anoxybacillus gonensis TaxID=198467 RepID=A0AAW7TL33_9BACL|nr:OsmC family protein [Anoxybacillus gonensis]AKS37257.1 osmotically inducible protein C [Anoxybacillus gonensis]KGP62089.1 osmotically inducible protein C [Anoxybacillus gonensis]MCX8047026.1 OsmC family protein [Anoxybacillus gonensis]MDO0878601.1 OsmC family protein [Anoxybacillus gonensis]
MNKMTFIVQATTEGMTTRAKAGKHEFVIDEAKQMGGQDLGANPLQMLLGALAACENVTARVVAREMNFDLQDMTFTVKGQFDPRGFMGDPSVRPYFDNVSVEVAVKTNESEERIMQLKEKVEARCPVYTLFKAAGVQMNDQWYKA